MKCKFYNTFFAKGIDKQQYTVVRLNNERVR